ncbi:MAG: hypothetical protein EXQ83_12870 [Xanthobacteraceae bacterium]|nr:hypothetical protein [Xanthobacteraceae bacterium]
MISAPHASQSSNSLRNDLLMALFLIGLCVVARLLLHVPNVSPVAASALFAGMMLRHRPLALAVPLAGMLIGDMLVGFYHWQVMIVVYAALVLPAVAGILLRHSRALRVVVPAVLGCSLLSFIATNFAVWAFAGLYSLDAAGLIQCYVAALPFLKYTIAGDLFWAAVLFGGAWLVQRLATRTTAVAARS